MLFKKFRLKFDNIIDENITSRYIIGILAVIIIVQQYNISNAMTSQKTVFMPPKIIDKEFWVSGNSVSKTYLENMGEFVSFNLFNVSKETVKRNIINLLTIVKSSSQETLKTKLIEQLTYITDNDISRVFYPSEFKTSTKGVIKVLGQKRDSIGAKIVDNKPILIEIYYVIEQGRFWLKDIQIKEGVKRL